MKKIFGILLCIIILVVVGYFVATKVFEVKFFESHKLQGEKNPKEEEQEDKEEKITIESIRALAKTLDEKIYTEENLRLVVDKLENGDIEIGFENGKLYLYLNENSSVVSNFQEEVVTMTMASSSCNVYSDDILLLTSTGNLYIIRGTNREGRRFDNKILRNLSENKEVELYSLTKVNKDDLKVLALTEYYHDGKCGTCGKGTVAIYTNDKKYRLYNNFSEIKNLESFTICGSTLGIDAVVYKNGKIATINGMYFKNKFGNDLVISEAYVQDNIAYIIDNTYYLYTIKNEESGPVGELYLNSRILEVKKENDVVRVIFESGKSVDIVNPSSLDAK